MNEYVLNLHDEDELDDFITILFDKYNPSEKSLDILIYHAIQILYILGYDKDFLDNYFRDAIISYFYHVYTKNLSSLYRK